ncbi:MAG TPA: SpvB/TcaC N-terminal domain-containing protein [Acidobacteriaceae bacterium]
MPRESAGHEDRASQQNPASGAPAGGAEPVSYSNQLPQIGVPKGGGAIRGIAEKFATSAATGSGSLSVPIATSPGRAGFSPQIAVTYDTGAGNGPFGLGWTLGLPSITRKTDKGLPQYSDGDGDVFLLSGAEDLVPALQSADWSPDIVPSRTVYGRQYRVERFRPRVDGMFARIERWTNLTDPGDCFWRSISNGNITSVYGLTADSRVADPDDASRIFSWLLCETFDGKGNVISYVYKRENSDGVDLAAAHEQNRTAATRSARLYAKRVLWGNRTPYLPDLRQPTPAPLPVDWCFELVFDYGEHDLANPTPAAAQPWTCRPDPFSNYRSAFETRTYRLCRRALMFHHFPAEVNVGANCLVKSTDFTYSTPPALSTEPVYSYLLSATQKGYVRAAAGGHVARSLPPLEIAYSSAAIDDTVRDIDPASLENLPRGIDGGTWRWVDLDGEGVSGILSEHSGSWYYKPNLSPANTHLIDGAERVVPRFGPTEVVARHASFAALGTGQQELLDLSGDGQLDLVQLDGPSPGYFERTEDYDWELFRPFRSMPVMDWRDPNLRFLDLTGDGLPDVLVTEDNVFSWRQSLGADGFGEERLARQSMDEERGPQLVFADGTETIFVADMSGDGMADLVRIRNGEVCYWPNHGYGRFGAKVRMDNAPVFDRPDLFDPGRLRLSDIDGSGTTDIVYLASDAVHLHFNQSGNSWTQRRAVNSFPPTESLSTASVLDLLGSGTACLVWSSPLPGDAARPMKYIDLMGGVKPHLAIRVINNLGAETRIRYAPSTKFYVADKLAGTPWVTRLPFPVHVVEQVQHYDYIGRALFTTRYSYHHGHYDGIEREFRGFGRVDQFDSESFAALSTSDAFPQLTNIEQSSHMPPVCTKTWFHTGALVREAAISRQYQHEYYSEGDVNVQAMQLPDTVLPSDLLHTDGTREPHDFSGEEIRQAMRALRGSVLRQEIYALDGTDESDRPYSVSERNYSVETLQPAGATGHAVFLTHARETVDFQYERKLYEVSGGVLVPPGAPPPARTAADPRVTHSMTLAIDAYGNPLRSVSIGYGRRYADPYLSAQDQARQKETLVAFTEISYTNAISSPDAHRTPLPAQESTYELLQAHPAAHVPEVTNLFRFDEMRTLVETASDGAHDIPFETTSPAGLNAAQPYRRLIARSRAYFRPDDLGASAADARALLPLGTVEPLAITGAAYKLAFTPGLIANVFRRAGSPLLPAPASVLGSVAADGGGYADLDGDGNAWLYSGRLFFDANGPSLALEGNTARQHFYLPRSFENAFGRLTSVEYDSPHDLAVIRTRDATGNEISAVNDYRVMAASTITDANGSQASVVFDALGQVTATAAMGKPGENRGDLPTGFTADLTDAQLDAFHGTADPGGAALPLLGNATTRILTDPGRFYRSRLAAPNDPARWLPAWSATLARETHHFDLAPGAATPIQISFTYSDGFGREVQKKTRAEAGPVTDGGPVVNPRWVASGWSIFNNKGKPVRQYEPFFSQLPARGHEFEFGVTVGVSPIVLYDPAGRTAATINPNHTWEKALFDPWRVEQWDVHDTVAMDDPALDPDVGMYFARLPDADYKPTWRVQRAGGALGPLERQAASKAVAHANTPSRAYFDTLGRTFLTVADNGAAGRYSVRVQLDIAGNRREITDPLGRVVTRCEYNLPGQCIHEAGMDSGERWVLTDIEGKPIRSWDSRGHDCRSEYDILRRPLNAFVRGNGAAADPRTTAAEVLYEKFEYGEGQLNDRALNLRTRVFRHRDTAGIAQNTAVDPATGTEAGFDFKGNPIAASRRFTRVAGTLPDWSQPDPPMAPDVWVGITAYDALNRLVTTSAPDGSVLRPTYNEAGLPDKVDARLPGAAAFTPFVGGIDYDAKGQRKIVRYGAAGAPAFTTAYSYHPLTFRLARLVTLRNGFPANEQTVQDLAYTYDATGNVSHIQDDADIQNVVFFRNRRMDPSADYTYDALYRLTGASGREQLGLAAGPPVPSSYNDVPRVNLPHPGDGNALGIYSQRYDYDDAGNLLAVRHTGTDPANPGWTRAYSYSETSRIEPGKFGNRLTSTTVNGAVPLVEPYTHDIHGNMTSMPHLPAMEWSFDNHLHMTRRQAMGPADADGVTHAGQRTFYSYGAGGERLRKTKVSAAGGVMHERFYLGPLEVYREYDNAGTVTLERHTLHVGDDRGRVALVETKTVDASNPGAPLPSFAIRFQLGNHLGSASLELDDAAAVISYEEYYPYGSTSYQAGRNAAETSLKRYRFAGMERDDETGLSCHGLRYYATWLGRWTSADPIGVKGGLNQYSYGALNPVAHTDSSGTQPDNGSTAVGITIGGGGLTLGPFYVPPTGPGSTAAATPGSPFVVGFGRTGPGFPRYMDTAEINTGLTAINIQDRINIRLGLGSHFPSSWAMEDTFATPGGVRGGLFPMFSGVMAQEALEGNAAGAVHFDARGIDITPPLPPAAPRVPGAPPDLNAAPGFSPGDYHSSSELRQGIATLASTDAGERAVDIYIQHEGGLSIIRRGANAVEGDPLPPRLADRMPNIVNRPTPPPTPPPPAVTGGSPTGSPNGSTAGAPGGTPGGSSNGSTTGTPGGSTGGRPGGNTGGNPGGTTGGSPGNGSGGNGLGPMLRSGTTGLLGGIGRAVPGIAELEASLISLGWWTAGTSTFASWSAPLMGAAEALPVAAGAGIGGAAAGLGARELARAAGASEETSNAIGFGTAVLAGAALGSFIPVVGTAAGAVIGGLLAGGLYLFSIW